VEASDQLDVPAALLLLKDTPTPDTHWIGGWVGPRGIPPWRWSAPLLFIFCCLFYLVKVQHSNPWSRTCMTITLHSLSRISFLVFPRRVLHKVPHRFWNSRKRLHSEELHNIYISPNIIRAIMSRRMIWGVHVISMGNMRNAYKFFCRNTWREESTRKT
jgi:hypothetical protein